MQKKKRKIKNIFLIGFTAVMMLVFSTTVFLFKDVPVLVIPYMFSMIWLVLFSYVNMFRKKRGAR